MCTIFSIVKFRKDLIFVRHMHYENKIHPKIVLPKYLSNKNYQLYGIRVALLACAVKRIKKSFPSEAYTGLTFLTKQSYMYM